MAPGARLPNHRQAFGASIRVGNTVRHKDGRQGIVTAIRTIGDGELSHAVVYLADGAQIAEPTGYFRVACTVEVRQ
jgi:hypothetical protein